MYNSIPAVLLDPYIRVGVQHNFSRSVWAAKGLAFAPMTLKNTTERGYRIETQVHYVLRI